MSGNPGQPPATGAAYMADLLVQQKVPYPLPNFGWEQD